jgi:hypothetical protein
MIKIKKEDFLNFFPSDMWRKHLIDSVVDNYDSVNKDKLLSELYEKIISYDYFPSPVKEYIFIEKHNLKVPRIVPVFELIDNCFLHFAMQYFDHKIAKNKVDNTFGGWVTGNAIRKKEDDEMDYMGYS